MKTYLGDAVYTVFDGWFITLMTDYGRGPTNIIHMEPPVYEALLRFVASRVPAPPCATCGGGGFVGGLHTSGPEQIPCPKCSPEDDGDDPDVEMGGSP